MKYIKNIPWVDVGCGEGGRKKGEREGEVAVAVAVAVVVAANFLSKIIWDNFRSTWSLLSIKSVVSLASTPCLRKASNTFIQCDTARYLRKAPFWDKRTTLFHVQSIWWRRRIIKHRIKNGDRLTWVFGPRCDPASSTFIQCDTACCLRKAPFSKKHTTLFHAQKGKCFKRPCITPWILFFQSPKGKSFRRPCKWASI